MKRGIISTAIPKDNWNIQDWVLSRNPDRPDIPGWYEKPADLSCVEIPRELIKTVEEKVGEIIYIRFKANKLLGIYDVEEVQSYLREEAKNALEQREAEKQK